MQNTAAEKESLLSDGDILDIVLEKEQEMIEGAEDCFDGLINPLIIKGPPGTSKTEGIKILGKQMNLKSHDIIASEYQPQLGPDGKPTGGYPYDCFYKHIEEGVLLRGADYAPWALCSDLFALRDGTGALVIDDNDEILKDTVAVAMLMDATEQTKTKTVKYVKANTTHDLQVRGIPPVFEVKTPIIILTNIDMQLMVDYHNDRESKTGKPAPAYIKRWSALMSRGQYIDLKMNTPRSVRVFCEHKVRKINMLTQSEWLEDKFGRTLTPTEQEDCLKWVRHNQGALSQPLSLRTYNHVAGIMIKRSANWEQSAKVRMLRSA